MKKILVFFMALVISMNANAQGVIRRDSSKDVSTSTSTTVSPSTRQKTNPLAVGKYGSLKGYHSVTHECGDRYEGYWDNGNFKGTAYKVNGIKMEGYFIKGELEGEGKIYNEDGSLAFNGIFHDGLPKGEGTLYLGGQPVYSKYWHDGFCAENVTFKMSETETFVGDFNSRVPWKGKIYSNTGVFDFWYDESMGTWRREPYNEERTNGSNTVNNISTNNTQTKSTSYNQPTGYENNHEYVDLGLSVKWATCNVGGVSPSDCGSYFAWGETQPKSNYDWRSCFDSLDGKGKKWYLYKKGGMSQIISSSGHDAARENWGGTWRMPTDAENEELYTRCTWTWTTLNGQYGYKVNGPSGKSIFLPAAGWRDETNLYGVGKEGHYYSSTLKSSRSSRAKQLEFYYYSSSLSGRGTSDMERRYGLTIRPVTE